MLNKMPTEAIGAMEDYLCGSAAAPARNPKQAMDGCHRPDLTARLYRVLTYFEKVFIALP